MHSDPSIPINLYEDVPVEISRFTVESAEASRRPPSTARPRTPSPSTRTCRL